MRPRTYSLPILQVLFTQSSDEGKPFAQLSTPADTPIEMVGLHLAQCLVGTPHTADGQFLLSLTQRSTATTIGSGTTPIKQHGQDPVSKLTASSTTNTVGTPAAGAAGTAVAIVRRWVVPYQQGLNLYLPTDARPSLEPSEFWTLEVFDAATSPATLTLTGDWVFAELL